MNIQPTPLADAYIADTVPFIDHRGSFARLFCSQELASVIGSRTIVNANLSRTIIPGTIRGLHFQHPPAAEMKLVRCIRGAVFDVFVDLRQNSPTFLQWHGVELSSDSLRMACIPEGFAHGFQSLTADAELLYLTTQFYSTPHEGGLNALDPRLNIAWPLPVSDQSDKDRSIPFINDAFSGINTH